MNSEDYGVVTEPGTVRLERILPGPIERVWAFLTESEKRGRWFASGKMELCEGGKVDLWFHHADLSHEKTVPEKHKAMQDGIGFTGQILRCEPPRLLAFTWGRFMEIDSFVTFELTEQSNDVLLVVTHRRIPDRGTMISFTSGWHTHIGILIDILNDREPRGFWSAHTQLEQEYDKRID